MPILNISKTNENFSVSNAFVDDFMCDANGSFVKVYLYCLRHSASSDGLSIAKIANVLNMIQSDVISALKYWDSVGVVKFEKKDKNDYYLELFDSFIKKSNNNIYHDANTPSDNPRDKKIISTNTVYSRSDIMTAMQGNEKINQLITLSSQLLNKTLNTNDMNIIYSFYDYLKFPPEVIFSLLEYCVSIGKSNMRYIEKVALSWADNDINTPQKASAFIKSKNKESAMLKKFKVMFKIVDRDFTDSEASLIKTWVNEYKLSDEDILNAYETTVMNTGKISFRYMEAVIKNKFFKNDSKTKQTGKKNSFQDYSSDGYEYEIEMIKRNLAKDN